LIGFRPLLASDLGQVERWFDDAETQRWLGGRDWPAQSLRLAGENRHVLLATDGGSIALLDVEIYDRHRASFAIVVAPAERRKGIGRQVVEAAIGHPLFSDVTEWFVGVERDNDASRGLVEKLGFRQMTDEDADGFTYYARGRDLVSSNWRLPD
jgi:ribosomal protein S18 acetylase RimI-like enzyme